MVSINRLFNPEDIGFKGDVENLQFNRTRWYDPALGRWLSEDPVGCWDSCNFYGAPRQPLAESTVASREGHPRTGKL